MLFFCSCRCILYHHSLVLSSAARLATAPSPYCLRCSPTSTPTHLSNASWLRQRLRLCVPLPCLCLFPCLHHQVRVTSSRKDRERSTSISSLSVRNKRNSQPNRLRLPKRRGQARVSLLEVGTFPKRSRHNPLYATLFLAFDV